MIYSQGFYHLDECPRTKSVYGPCSCDLLKLQQTVPVLPVPSEAEVAQIEAS
jgi:hypothetical protein